MGELVPIERKEGVTIYGRVIGKGGKLGLFEVHSDFSVWDEIIYSLYPQAETRMSALIGVKNSDTKRQNQKQ